MTALVLRAAPGPIPKNRLQARLKAGYTKRPVLDVVRGVSLKTLSNYTNHITGTPLNKQFESERWEAPGDKAARESNPVMCVSRPGLSPAAFMIAG